MEKQTGIDIKLVGGKKKEIKKYPKKKFYNRKQPYLLPCGNDKEHCFLKVGRKNTNFCRTWKKIIWAKCRHHIETDKYKWEQR